jgi:hypothetical protein
MKTMRELNLLAAALIGTVALAGTAFAQSTRWDELSKLPFKESYPTAETSARLFDELQFQRAVQAYLWALPAMNMVAMRDGQAATFYRLHVPANVPAANYWSVVLYDNDTRSLLDNGQPFPSIASNSNLKPNADGSSDIWFGPTAPKAANANWLKTIPGKGYFVGMRLYAPTQAFFDKLWKPDDIMKVK